MSTVISPYCFHRFYFYVQDLPWIEINYVIWNNPVKIESEIKRVLFILIVSRIVQMISVPTILPSSYVTDWQTYFSLTRLKLGLTIWKNIENESLIGMWLATDFTDICIWPIVMQTNVFNCAFETFLRQATFFRDSRCWCYQKPFLLHTS